MLCFFFIIIEKLHTER